MLQVSLCTFSNIFGTPGDPRHCHLAPNSDTIVKPLKLLGHGICPGSGQLEKREVPTPICLPRLHQTWTGQSAALSQLSLSQAILLGSLWPVSCAGSLQGRDWLSLQMPYTSTFEEQESQPEREGFLNFDTIDILRLIILCCGGWA